MPGKGWLARTHRRVTNDLSEGMNQLTSAPSPGAPTPSKLRLHPGLQRPASINAHGGGWSEWVRVRPAVLRVRRARGFFCEQVPTKLLVSCCARSVKDFTVFFFGKLLPWRRGFCLKQSTVTQYMHDTIVVCVSRFLSSYHHMLVGVNVIPLPEPKRECFTMSLCLQGLIDLEGLTVKVHPFPHVHRFSHTIPV